MNVAVGETACMLMSSPRLELYQYAMHARCLVSQFSPRCACHMERAAWRTVARWHFARCASARSQPRTVVAPVSARPLGSNVVRPIGEPRFAVGGLGCR